MTPRFLIALTATLLAEAQPAAACSVSGNYRVPSNLELVERADAIILGRVEQGAPAADGYGIGEVVIRPLSLLKGPALPAELRILGQLAVAADQVTTSNPRDLYNPNPDTLSGGCTRYTYRPGMLLVVFLQRDDSGRLRLSGYPFARTSEDVPNADAPWVKAVRLYAEIAALPEPQRRAALIARRDRLRADTSDPGARLIADDIDRQLARRPLRRRD